MILVFEILLWERRKEHNSFIVSDFSLKKILPVLCSYQSLFLNFYNITSIIQLIKQIISGNFNSIALHTQLAIKNEHFS